MNGGPLTANDTYVQAVHQVPDAPYRPGSLKFAPRRAPDHQNEYALLIRQRAAEKGLGESAQNTLVWIAWCESGLGMKWNWRHSENPDYFTAYGLFQVIKSHELKYGIDRMTVEGNIALALILYQRNGTSDWSASRSCWQNAVN